MEQREKSPAMGWLGIVLITIYLILAFIITLVTVLKFWSSATAASSSTVTYFFWTTTVSQEVGLLLLIVLVGALGSIVHAVRSLYWHVGRRTLRVSRWPKYVLLPTVGPSIALVLYLLVRGGFFAGGDVSEGNVYGFLALAGLAGMFSEQATELFRKLAEQIFAKPEPLETEE